MIVVKKEGGSISFSRPNRKNPHERGKPPVPDGRSSKKSRLWYNVRISHILAGKDGEAGRQVTGIFRYAFVFVAVVAVFARSAGFSYIGLDDAAYTFRNPFVAGGFSVCNAVEAFCDLGHGGIWMPATYISYMLDSTVSKALGLPLVGWMHAVNVLLHALNAVLLAVFAGMLPKRRDGSAPSASAAVFAVLVWALHPLRAEPVAWIAARKELLWSFFALAGLLFWSRGNRISAYVCCALSCFSKPTAVCFPLLALLLDLYCGSSAETSLRKRAATYLPFFIFAAATACIAAYSQTHVSGQAPTELFAAPLPQRIIGAISAVGFYLRSLVWPFGLHVDCRSVTGLMPIGGVANIAFACVFTVLFAVAWFRRKGGEMENRRFRALLAFCAAWFLVSLFPTLGILGSFGMEAHADRFTYLPMMAFAFLFSAVRIGTSAKILVLSALTALAYIQLGYWRDDAVAHARALECDPGHPRAMVHVADSRCSRRRDFDGGIELYRKALSLADTVPAGGFNTRDTVARLAYALASRGRYGDFCEVLSLGADVLKDPSLDRRGMMLDALGTAFMYRGDFVRAGELFRASLAAPGRFWPKASTKHKLGQCSGNTR